MRVFCASPTSGTCRPEAARRLRSLQSAAAITYGGVLSVISDATAGGNVLNVSGTVPEGEGGGTTFNVWGGPGDTQGLGYWTCTFCKEFGSDSINNQYGNYGSPYSPTSIRNRYGRSGSPYGAYSSVQPVRESPPGCIAATGAFYGVLTLNPFAYQAIPSLMNWLRTDVCQ